MSSRLSISSSSDALAPRGDTLSAPSREALRRATTFARRLPHGAFVAVLLVAIIHASVVAWVYPDPIARKHVRRKTAALTANRHTTFVVAGDSRSHRHIIPGLVAGRIGLDPDQAINIGRAGASSSRVLAAFREFRHRFDANPVMLLSLSLWSVNDDCAYLGNEVLWSLSLADRLRVTDPGSALLATFLPERTLAQNVTNMILDRVSIPHVPDQGFVSGEAKNSMRYTPEEVDRVWALYQEDWFRTPKIDGVRWRLLQSDLRALQREGARVVMVDSPFHPSWITRIAGTPEGDAFHAFRKNLADLSQRMNIPLLSYQDEWLGDGDPDKLFWDLVHLNTDGARVLSERIAEDLTRLIAEGKLDLPD